MTTIDISGKWLYEADPENIGKQNKWYDRRLANDGFALPGSACENGVGTPCAHPDENTQMNYEAVRTLRPRFDYVGALWLQREIEIGKDFENKHVTLFLERVNIASELWLDGVKIARQIVELSAPHIYDLTGKITAGKHTLTLRIDNSNLLNLDIMASGYSVDTQSVWLGIIGKIELRAEEIFHMENIQVFPEENTAKVQITACSDCTAPHDKKTVSVTLQAVSPSGEALSEVTYTSDVYNKKQILHLEYPLGENIMRWDEFHPNLYTLRAVMEYENQRDEKTVSFGVRKIEADGKQFKINGRPLSLRGTLDCAIYPMTGYPPTDIDEWLKIFAVVKEYGLNHVRFHAWCPPEAAFAAADIAGIYVLAEMPLWLNTDVCALATGDDPIHEVYFSREALTISKTYGNHPSFIMFSNGNELLGDFEMLEYITAQVKAVDNRRLYTLTSNFDRAVSPADDYFNAFQAAGHRIRIQVFHDVVSEHTRLCYDDAVNALDIPIVSFEVGQYCVYPDVDSVKDFTGNLLPVNFELIGMKLKQSGLYPKLRDYIAASGRLAALLYKEDIECALRTHKMGGFQLLGIHDYTGQGTATIGILDVFRRSKGIIPPEEWRGFCSDVVPLLKTERIFYSDETLTADLDLYDYGEEKIENPVYKLELFDGNTLVKSVETSENHISFALDFIKKPSMLKAELSVNDHKNHWNIFVYPRETVDADVKIISGFTPELESMIENGGKAVVLANADDLAEPIEGLFKPVFWSPAHFPQKRACGLIIDSSHPIFEGFPTGDYADFQWKHPTDHSTNADLTALPRDFKLLIEPVPNFADNTPRSPLFEAVVGKAQILFCGFDLAQADKASNALKNSILTYAASDKFAPKQALDIDLFKKLFK